jgi:hypothetical protein
MTGNPKPPSIEDLNPLAKIAAATPLSGGSFTVEAGAIKPDAASAEDPGSDPEPKKKGAKA